MNLDGKFFRSVANVGNGDVSDLTVFHYHQRDDYLWGSYEGGNVSAGVLIGKVDGMSLDFNYAHYDLVGQYRTGRCHSVAKVENGVLRLYEDWQWTSGDLSKGQSIIEEIKD